MAHPKLRTKMGKAGRVRAANVFSWAATAKKTCNLYESLISRRTIETQDLLSQNPLPLPKLGV